MHAPALNSILNKLATSPKKTKTEDAALLLQTLIKCEAHLKDKTITTAEKLALANALPVLFFQIPKLRIKNV